MIANNNTTLPNLSAVCQGPLSWRVQSATRVINECSAKEVSGVFRTLVQSVFGAAGPSDPGMLGWGLQLFTKGQHPTEYQQLYNFLCSQGPLVTIALRHAQDPYMHFEFPISFLPASAQAGIAEGSAGPLYTGKVHNPGPGKLPHTILLNSLEYYLFHFCYYLLHVGQSEGCEGLAWTCVGDAIYPSLLEDYLTTFLPCDGSAPPAPQHICPDNTPLPNRLAASGLQQLTNLMSPISTPQRGGSPQLSAPYTSSPLVRGGGQQPLPPRHATWTSQTVAQILVEMWINVCQPGTSGRHPSTPHSPPSSPLAPRYASSPQQQMQMGWCQQDAAPPEYRPHWFLQPVPLGIAPSIMSEHIRAVRMIIKHFHYFSNSTKPAQPSPLDPLRRTLWTMCRKSFYGLFVQLLARWPLDSSFRLLLEAWLSYIQPWRYTDINRPPDTSESSLPVDWSWQRFVADNLLLYSGILAAVLPRLLRLDLSAPKNAHMLYRITKVLSLPNLSSLLQATEDALLCSSHSLLPHSPPSDPSPQGGRLTPHAAMMVARSHLLEMEGSHYVYTPIFGQHTLDLIREVMCSVRSAEAAVEAELDAIAPPKQSGSSGGGAVSTLVSWLQAAAGGAVTADNTTEELQRSLLHLQAAADHLHSLFGVSGGSTLHLTSDSSPSKSRAVVPDQVLTDHGFVLTDEGRRQLVSGLRRKDLKFEGDPDLRPIGFGEFALLVRWLYSLATFLNTKYASRLLTGYHSTGVIGVLWRCVLQPPLIVYEYHKPGGVSHSECGAAYPTRVARHLPPRLCFRAAASRQAVVSVVAASLLLQVLCGLSLPSQLLYVLLPALLLYFLVQLLLSATGRAAVATPRS